MANLSKWFGYPIYINKLENFEEINKKIVPIILKDITPTNSQYSTTTDIKAKELQTIDDNLHTDIRFKKLYNELSKVIQDCLSAQKYNLNLLEAYITKSWATLSVKDQFISYHRHMSSHFSFVYYPQAYEQGNLFLLDDDAHKVGLNIPKRDPYFTEWNQSNYGKAEYPAETGNVIIFPSMMFHETAKNTKDKPRISISGDIMVTMKEGVKSEHNIPSPATWKKL
tara:strand:+ start:1609 stop:2283 length:675 start_codon:yes stop_codon:yes gene_type:complete